jgi:predicted Zn finger-like uncharacterized protein
MFTVCPKCALTLVVTAQDLRVAQGYVRCGRCSNVFNAIVGLTDDRGALASSGPQATATTSIIRKAPSIPDDEPAAPDSLHDTGESEAIYAEPDEHEVKFQEVFAEPTPPTPHPETRATGPISFVAPPPGPPAQAQGTSTQKALDSERRYSDTEGIETYPENELEFNPDVTDVTQVFVEAAPVTFKGDATGRFRKFVMGEEQPDPTEPGSGSDTFAAPNGAKSPTVGVPPAQTAGNPAGSNAKPSPGTSATQAAGAANAGASNAKPVAGAQMRAASNGAASPGAAGVKSPASAAQAPSASGAASADGGSGAAGANGLPGANGVASTNGSNSSAKPATSARNAAPGSQSSPARIPAPSAAPPRAPGSDADDEDDENLEFDADLRSLAAQIDVTSSRPAARFPSAAANDEAVDADADDEGRGLGDIYAKAVPRPRPPAAPPRPAASSLPAERNTSVEDSDDFATDADAEMQAVDSAIETFTPAAPPRSRFMWWVGGAAVLSLLLAGQAVHHNRHSLATNALLNRPLTKFYKAIGVPLVPSWDLRSYDVRQLGASTNEGGEDTLTVRASLKNNSSQPLPLPLLRITMQDRYGNRIATRDVPPSGYVPGALPAEAHLGVGQRIDAEMTFKDPGQNAVGFEIDACLATASGRVACANDQPPAPR